MIVPITATHVSSLPARFWSKVDDSGECWLWTASLNGSGYGNYSRGGVNVGAHRAAWEDRHGPIPPKMELDHNVCYIHHCVNPDHVRLTTKKQNMENRTGATRTSTSGARGVYWHKRSARWVAKVRHHGKEIHVGYFETIPEAEAAVIAKRLELFTHNDRDRVNP